MSSMPVKADANFLRRVFVMLVGLTVLSGAMAGFATVQAMNAPSGVSDVQE